MTDAKLLTMTQLRHFLGKHLPNAPTAHKIYAAIGAGMPHFADAVSGRKLFDGAAVLKWWLEPKGKTETPEDAAIKARRRAS